MSPLLRSWLFGNLWGMEEFRKKFLNSFSLCRAVAKHFYHHGIQFLEFFVTTLFLGVGSFIDFWRALCFPDTR